MKERREAWESEFTNQLKLINNNFYKSKKDDSSGVTLLESVIQIENAKKVEFEKKLENFKNLYSQSTEYNAPGPEYDTSLRKIYEINIDRNNFPVKFDGATRKSKPTYNKEEKEHEDQSSNGDAIGCNGEFDNYTKVPTRV